MEEARGSGFQAAYRRLRRQGRARNRVYIRTQFIEAIPWCGYDDTYMRVAVKGMLARQFA